MITGDSPIGSDSQHRLSDLVSANTVQTVGIEVLEVTTPDRHDRRRRGKNDDLDAQNAAHAAFAGQRTVTPRSRDGMVESLRVLSACRKTAVGARRVGLQLIQNKFVRAPDGLRDVCRYTNRMARFSH